MKTVLRNSLVYNLIWMPPNLKKKNLQKDNLIILEILLCLLQQQILENISSLMQNYDPSLNLKVVNVFWFLIRHLTTDKLLKLKKSSQWKWHTAKLKRSIYKLVLLKWSILVKSVDIQGKNKQIGLKNECTRCLDLSILNQILP